MESEFKSHGYKKNHLLQILVDAKQKERLIALASASGLSTSEYIRNQCLNPEIHAKLNKILEQQVKLLKMNEENEMKRNEVGDGNSKR